MNKKIIIPASINVMYNKSCNCYQYRLIIYNAKMSKLLENKKIRAKVVRQKDIFYLIKDDEGNLLTPRPKSQNLFMSIKKILKNDFLPRKGKKSSTFNISLKLDPSEWGLTTLDRFLESKEEKELAKELIFLNYEVDSITYNDKEKLEKGCADLLVKFKKYKIPIEITTTSPSKNKKKGINSPHGHQWAKIAVRILPLLLSFEYNKKFSFFIMGDKWKRYNHVNYFVNKLEKFGCFVIFTSFLRNWSREVSQKIDLKLKELK